MEEEVIKSRVIGLLLLCAGIILTCWNYSMRQNDGSYYLQLAFLGPLIIGLAVNLVIEAPKIPVNKPSIFGWLCLLTGTGVGLWNAIF